MHRSAALVAGIAALATLALSRPTVGQCPLEWLAGDPIRVVHGNANASAVWDPDGAGPATPVLVVGGRFGVGTMLATSLASFDGASWSPLGAPPLAEVTALTTWNGLLVAAGGSGTQHAIATWNGLAWSVVGNTNGRVHALAVFNGNLFAGGFFNTLDSQPVSSLAQWNGTAWSAPGGGVTGEVRALAVFGSLYVGGTLTQAGPVAVGNLAIWNGTTWSPGPAFDARVRCLAVRSGATAATSFLFAGGEFHSVGAVPAHHIARLTASTNAWTAIPGLPGTTCRALHVRSTSLSTFQLHAAVEDTTSSAKVWRLNGTTWQSLGSVVDDTEPLPTSLAFFAGEYVATFTAQQIAAATLQEAVRSHDGTQWRGSAGPGFDGPVLAATKRGGELVVGGAFTRYGNTNLVCIARGQPGNWQPLGSGMGGVVGVFALCTMANGDVVAGGEFTTAGGVPAASIARWNGTTWSPLGSGVTGSVRALQVLPDDSLIAAGSFPTAGGVLANNIARWNGTSWSALGTGTDAAVIALARRGNGELVATGSFAIAGGTPAARIARWNGVTWSALGTGLDDAGLALTVLRDDSVVAGGLFQNAGGVFSPGVARWNGSTWLAESAPTFAWDSRVDALAALPNGDYLAGGRTSFFGLGGPFGGTDANLARRTPAQWSPLALLGFQVADLLVLPDGDVVVSGTFDGAGGIASQSLAVLRPTCPATAAVFGSGCAGAGGANEMASVALPWLGSTFRARATGMPAVGLAIAVTGFTPIAVPLPSVLPQGGPGCSVLVSPDFLELALPSAGVATTQLAVPMSAALAGQTFHQQVVALQMDVAGNILAATSTNGVTATIGVL